MSILLYIYTELQLAALLGKTLLEKNAELEKKLRKLQDFAEEAVAENEVCTRRPLYNQITSIIVETCLVYSLIPSLGTQAFHEHACVVA